MDLNKFKTNSKSELEGVWVPVGDKGRLLLARANNRNYRQRLHELLKPHRVHFKTDTLPPDVVENAVAQATAETVLLGWEDLTDDGVGITYSPKEAFKQLTDKPDFLGLVAELSDDILLFRKQSDKAAGNDLPATSAGDSV